MKLFHRYIGRHVLYSVLSVLLLFTLLGSLFTFIVELGNLQANYQFIQALQFVILGSPWMLIQVLPIAVMIGGIIGLGILSNRGEIVIMQVTGMSKLKICWVSIKSVLSLLFICLILDLFILPKLQYNNEHNRDMARYPKGKAYTKNSLWWKDNNNMINIGSINGQTVEYIDIFEFENHNKLKSVIHARSARKVNNQWTLFDGIKTTYKPNQVDNTPFTKQAYHLDFDVDLLKVSMMQPEDLNIRDLVKNIQYQKKQHIDTRNYELSLYQRLFQPFRIAVLLLLATSFIFGPLRSVTMGQRIFIGTLTSLTLMLIQNLIPPFGGVFNIPPIVSFFIPIFLVTGASIILLRKA